ncbi:peptidoglycan/LPS O-acetylase OafA/YrhL [Mycolicibacterium iranicum]|uniref:Peptidoglycan/LPS O-acetylase OafA/YrhL n=1 Tax=Mycolicibacterium iranicum TaxID=912594 RepID=A0A839Q4W1_MYCIR|nr:hypothetical protein [Mycolicibacterium iranicum]MBB2991120.1 peptidoglycan/LPS O-acetylase OafA/YrhL [Mycolicibacterium iranicum]
MPDTGRQPSPRPFLLTSRIFALLTVAVVVVLFGTAGALVQAGDLENVHGTAAIVLHVATGGLMVALAGLAYTRRRGWWSAVLAFVVFAFTFIQASLGEGATLNLHVPGSLVIVAATIWLTAWLFSSGATADRAAPMSG